MIPENQMREDMAQALESAGVNPAYVYAFRRCGYIVTETNAEVFTDAERRAWEAAVREYEDTHP